MARRAAWTAISFGFAMALYLASTSHVLALGGGGGSSPSQSAAPRCPSGQYYSQRCKECARQCRSNYVWECGRGCVQRTGMIMPDEEIYAEAVSLIRARHYSEGLELLWAIETRQDPQVLNYIGFATRKLGNVDKGINYYHKALAIDPDYTLAREYLGEGYLQKGDVASAKRQLGEIRVRCGESCREYAVLATAIADHEAGRIPAKASW
jgi:tetratricopeptide (TPR) repeat protein